MKLKFTNKQLLQLCMARKVFSILVTVWLYTVMPEVCRWLTNEKQKKLITRCFLKSIKVGVIIEHYTKIGLIKQHWRAVQCACQIALLYYCLYFLEA